MAKEELIQFEGLVLEALPDTRFRVQLDSGHEIIAYTAGKMKKNRIKTLAGDRVTVPPQGRASVHRSPSSVPWRRPPALMPHRCGTKQKHSRAETVSVDVVTSR
jgi:translation initiation factor IF-1